MKSTIVLTALLSGLLFASCEMNSERKSAAMKDVAALNTDENKIPSSDQIADPVPANNSDQNAGKTDSTFRNNQKLQQANSVAKVDWDKKIIKSATINAEVKEYNTYYSSLREKIRSVGGYVSQEQQSESANRIENTLSIKVPVDQFDILIDLLSTGAKIVDRNVTSRDVTTEVVDTKSRIESKKHVRDRYTEFLKQAKNLEEVLTMQREINGIQEDIESATGKISYLSHSSSFSTINLTVYQLLAVPITEPQAPGFWNSLATSFKTGLTWITDFTIAIASIWPLLILFFIAWRLVKKYGKTTSGNIKATQKDMAA